MEKPADRPNFTALVQRLDNVIASNMANMVSTTIYCFTSSNEFDCVRLCRALLLIECQ